MIFDFWLLRSLNKIPAYPWCSGCESEKRMSTKNGGRALYCPLCGRAAIYFPSLDFDLIWNSQSTESRCTKEREREISDGLNSSVFELLRPEFTTRIADHNLAVIRHSWTEKKKREFESELTITTKKVASTSETLKMTDVMQSYNYNTLYAYQQQAVSACEILKEKEATVMMITSCARCFVVCFFQKWLFTGMSLQPSGQQKRALF